MLDKQDLNYLAMLVVIDQREAIRICKENNQLEQVKERKDARKVILDKLNVMYDELDKGDRDMKIELKDTVKMMKSSDYKERFRAEVLQLALRIEGLENMLKKYKEGTLEFEPKCSYAMLDSQLFYMKRYLGILEERAKIERIDLSF